MIRKIIPALFILVIVGVLSCDNESVQPAKKAEEKVAAPPTVRTINMHGRLKAGATSVDVYYQIPTAALSWTYLTSITSTQCASILASFNASDGDTVEISVVDIGTFTGRNFLARLAAGCPSSGTNYCGNVTDGSDYSFTVSGNMDFAIQAQIPNCYF